MSTLYLVSLAGVVSFITTALLVRTAPVIGLLDHPIADRKSHDAPTPVVGGLGILAGLIVFPAFAGVLDNAQWFWLLSAAVLLAAIGVADDRYDLRWYWRIAAQVLAALLIAIPGQTSIQSLGASTYLSLELGSWALPFTIFAVVGVINATNMIDGMDGLAGTMALVSLLAMALIASEPQLSQFLWATVAMLLAFLAFNLRRPGLPRAACFLGNSGSAIVGLVLAWSAIRLTASGDPSPSIAPWLVALPILDCLIQIARRLLNRRSPFSADSGHLHHLLTNHGWSVGATVAVLVGMHVAFVCVGIGFAYAGSDALYPISGFISLLPLLGLGYWALNRHPMADDAINLTLASDLTSRR